MKVARENRILATSSVVAGDDNAVLIPRSSGPAVPSSSDVLENRFMTVEGARQEVRQSTNGTLYPPSEQRPPVVTAPSVVGSAGRPVNSELARLPGYEYNPDDASRNGVDLDYYEEEDPDSADDFE